MGTYIIYTCQGLKRSQRQNGTQYMPLSPFNNQLTIVSNKLLFQTWHTVFWSKLEIVLYTLFVLSCPTKLTGLNRTVSTFVPCYTKFTLLIWTKMARTTWTVLVGIIINQTNVLLLLGSVNLLIWGAGVIWRGLKV